MEFHLTGRLGKCLLLAYRTPARSVRELVPSGLQLVTEGPWAFWNVVACSVERMRPRGLPSFCGLTYHHVAYRLYVRAQLADGTETQGLYFVRSDADSRIISLTGNWCSDFRFHSAHIELSENRGINLRVRSADGRGDVELAARAAVDDRSTAGSYFASRQQREAVLKYRPEAFSTDTSGRCLRIASVHRNERLWKEEPLEVTSDRWTFLDSLGQNELLLERATQVAPINYRWSLGREKRLRKRSI